MCGIAGKISLNGKPVSLTDLKPMGKAIAHRGPDDEGFYISPDKKIGIVNRRLAIIDLSQKGHQPMSYLNRYIITYNGEVYNFSEERQKLLKLGYKFRSKTDTEVILALYHKYGKNCLSHLRGMFSFIIYDKKEKTIFGARDRIGKKPFKYYLDTEVFIFASELKAILTQKEVKKIPDFIAIDYYLTYGYTPSPLTGFAGIKKLPPGHYMTFNMKNKKMAIKRYWRPNLEIKLNLSESEWQERILDELQTATKMRMISDVPIGVFLSGGVDSSAVLAMMARSTRNQIKTFSIIFKDNKYNEGVHAKRLAELYKTDHNELLVNPESIDILPHLAYQYEEPFADSSFIITFLISQLARKSVTIAINGDGGDENFAGYDRHLRIDRDSHLERFSILKPIAKNALSLLSPLHSSRLERSRRFIEKSYLPLSHRYASYNRYFSNENKESLYSSFFKGENNSDSLSVIEKIFQESNTSDLRDRGLYFDLTSYLPEDLLAKVDIASMANSLEARSPLLDHKLIELACQIPYSLKVKGKETKYIFKKSLEGIVPKENLYRRKMGFSVPLDKWFTGSLNKFTSSKLLSKNAGTRKLFNQEVIKGMLANHSEKNDFGPRLWSLLALELWFESYFN